MTQEELKAKLDASLEKVESRKNTIEKVCKKLGINSESLFNEYNNAVSNLKDNYLRSAIASEIVSKFVSKKTTYDSSSFEYNSRVEQLSDNLSKLYEVEKVAKGWQEKYDTQKNKENAPKIEAIWEFLNNWEVKARDWYVYNSKELEREMNNFHTLANDYLIEIGYDISKYYNQEERKEFTNQFNTYFSDEYGVHSRYRWSDIDADDWINQTTNIDNLTKDLSTIRFNQQDNYSYDQVFGYSAHKGNYFLAKFDLEKLNKILAQEKLNKYYDLCNRISAVVGEITDASNLSIGNQKGEINGIVVGTKGKARVETISAGGYNQGIIVNDRHGQIFHYRVLVHPIK